MRILEAINCRKGSDLNWTSTVTSRKVVSRHHFVLTILASLMPLATHRKHPQGLAPLNLSEREEGSNGERGQEDQRASL